MTWDTPVLHAIVDKPPTIEPITAEDAALYLRLDADAADVDGGLALRLVSAAREYCEDYCDRAFAAQQWRVVMDDLTQCTLPGGEVGDVVSFTYEDAAGKTQTVPPERYTLSRNGALRLNPGQRWPEGRCAPDSVQIVYKVGGDRVPEAVVHAIRMLLAHYYENRQAAVIGATGMELPLGVDALLARHRVISL